MIRKLCLYRLQPLKLVLVHDQLLYHVSLRIHGLSEPLDVLARVDVLLVVVVANLTHTALSLLYIFLKFNVCVFVSGCDAQELLAHALNLVCL